MSETIEQPSKTVAVVAPDAAAIAGNVVQLCGDAADLDVDSPEMLELAGKLTRMLLDRATAIENKRLEFTRPLDELKKKFMSEFAPSIDALRRAAETVKRKALVYSQEQERVARERQAQAEEAARKERQRLQREADKLEAAGKVEKAEAKRDLADALPAVVMPPALAPVKGSITYRDKWRAKVTDLPALVRCIAARPEYLALISVNQSELDRLAGVFKKEFSLDGVVAECEKIPVAPRA
jgi:hypothetical protein